MKFTFLFIVYTFLGFQNASAKEDPIAVLNEMIAEISQVNLFYQNKKDILLERELQINEELKKPISIEKKVDLLIEKGEVNSTISEISNFQFLEISKIRYLKGIQVIRLLYGKILALDHHFAAVSSLHDINSISNPNSFPEFISAKAEIQNAQDRRHGFDLTSILGNNVYTSVVHTLVSVFTGTGNSKQEKTRQISNIECILDFTLSVHNDLNTIYFETAFLKKQNENIKQDILQLFNDFTQPIKYESGLEDFRKKDDWDELRTGLEAYLDELKDLLKDKTQQDRSRRMRVNLEFPTDRLLQFISQYNTFINQGTNFYEKFYIMLDSYEEKGQCASKTPVEYKRLKEGINITIEKFNTAYKPIEINGNKLKEVLYGLNEYN
ncbi:MAG: hypothetical protein CVU03_05815 [Bacteroidetes bacterium HGW-Bacteroidetes-2]|jgi:hypothetical protein|nr:MAG: hypothetical protein CVU03_05815 [Bacteroidetes bacterium HGW-Bacteroidetes-2]